MAGRRGSFGPSVHGATDLARWRGTTEGMSESCERVFDIARGFALGRGSEVIRVEHFVWSLLHNGRHASTASFLSNCDIDIPKLLRLVQAACHVVNPLPPQDGEIAPKLVEAINVAREICVQMEPMDIDADPRFAAQSILAVLMLDARGNFAARALRESLPGQRGQRGESFSRLRANSLAMFEIVDPDQIRRIKRAMQGVEDPDEGDDTPEEYTCPISGEVMVEPATTAMGQTYERRNIERWLRDHNTDPLTNARLANRNLTPNHALRSLIQRWEHMKAEATIPPPTPAMDMLDTPASQY